MPCLIGEVLIASHLRAGNARRPPLKELLRATVDPSSGTRAERDMVWAGFRNDQCAFI